MHRPETLAAQITYAWDIRYRAFDAVKSWSGSATGFSASYDNRMRPTSWNVANRLGYNYAYDFGEHTGRVNYAQNIYDSTLDRGYEYDQVGALVFAHSGAEARAQFGLGPWGISNGPYSHMYDYDQQGNMTRRFGWGGEVQGGAPNGGDTDIPYGYSNGKNQRDGFTYDPAGNLTNDGGQTYSYDATNQQASASGTNYFLQQGYDGDGLRGSKTENGTTTYYLRSTVLGGAVVAEVDGNGGWSRGYVYAGGELMAVQQGWQLYWVHEDSVTKSKRITDVYGNVVSTVELDPWGANTNLSSNAAFLPQSFTSYIRDANGGQDAMARRYSVGGRFSQPDPYGGSYDFANPQSLNRYAYTTNDPVNFRDPSGLDTCYPDPATGQTVCVPDIVATVTVTAPSSSGPIIGNSILGGDEMFRMELSSDTGGGDLGGGGPQDPYNVRTIIAQERNKIIERNRQQNRLDQARKEFRDCLANNPAYVASARRTDEAFREHVTTSILPIPYLSIGRVTYSKIRYGTALTSVASRGILARGTVFSLLINSVWADAILRQGEQERKPIVDECRKKIETKYGFRV